MSAICRLGAVGIDLPIFWHGSTHKLLFLWGQFKRAPRSDVWFWYSLLCPIEWLRSYVSAIYRSRVTRVDFLRWVTFWHFWYIFWKMSNRQEGLFYGSFWHFWYFFWKMSFFYFGSLFDTFGTFFWKNLFLKVGSVRVSLVIWHSLLVQFFTLYKFRRVV